MMYSEVCWLLLFVITAGVSVDCEVDEIPLIQWVADCDSYQVTTGVFPRVMYIHGQLSTPLAQCRSLCTGRTDCGGFGRSTGDYCHLYNMNDQIIEQHLSQNWYGRSSNPYMWYSKTCAYNVGDSDLSCNSYTERQYHNQFPSYKWRITSAGPIPDLTATECQQWCTLYTSCRSVTYEPTHRIAFCYLHETTIQDLLQETGSSGDDSEDSALDDDVVQKIGTDWTYTTYDRYCATATPYAPDR